MAVERDLETGLVALALGFMFLAEMPKVMCKAHGRNMIGVTEDRSSGGCTGVPDANIISECFKSGTS